MSAFEDHLKSFRAVSDSMPYARPEQPTVAGLRTIAEGLAEVIALLRPLVETVTAKPEPLKLRTDGTEHLLPCLAGDPSSGGFRRCTEPHGHGGDHRHVSKLSNVEHVWTQRPGDVPQLNPDSGVCGSIGPLTWGRHHVCALTPGHNGVHTDGDTHEVTW